MKSRTLNSSRVRNIDDKFKDLNINEMTNIRGGGNKGVPTLPPTGGDDFPIILSAITVNISSISTWQQLPTLQK